MSEHHDPQPAAQPGLDMQGVPELLAHALALEVEAGERYAMLAEIMETHHNAEVARLFARMADIEKGHVEAIRQEIARRGIQKLPAARYRWAGIEGPETTDPMDLHYLMTPHQALSLALLNEQRASEYFTGIACDSSDPEVVTLASELAEEEREHVQWVEQWIARFAAPEEGWDRDDDPPNLQA